MATTISTIYRATVEVPYYLYAKYGDTPEYATKSAQFKTAANVDAAGQDAYGDVEEWAEDSSRERVENWAAMWEGYVTELARRVAPEGATHYADAYCDREFYRRRVFKHLNQVSEEWEDKVRWDYWTSDGWEDAGAGFSDRRLKPIAGQ